MSSVPSQDELPLGDDAIELVREPAADEPVDLTDVPEPTPITADDTWDGADLVSHAEAPEPAEVGQTPLLPDPGDVTADADWIAESDAATGPEDGPATPDEVDAGTGTEVGGTADAEPLEPTPPRPEPPGPKKKSRSSVPSWDEIMFGGKSE